MFDVVRILWTKRALTARGYNSSALRLKKALIWMLALSSLMTACDFLYMDFHGLLGLEFPFFGFACACLLYAPRGKARRLEPDFTPGSGTARLKRHIPIKLHCRRHLRQEYA
jgi:hypothetical protein